MTRQDPYTISGINSHFKQDFKSFDEYIRATHQAIEEASHFDKDITKDTIALTGPKLFRSTNKDNKHGVILIHGLLDNCSIMSSVFDHFVSHNITVYNLLLPGHGSRPGDLLETTHQEWQESLNFAIRCLKEEVEDICLIGLSTGAILSTLAAFDEAAVKSLILYAPAFAFNSPFAGIIPTMQSWNQICPPFAKEWIFQREENNPVKYQSLTTNAVYQLRQIINKYNEIVKTRSLDKPWLFFLTMDDETINSTKARDIFYHNPHKKSKLVVFSNNEDAMNQDNCLIMPSCIPKKRILNFSHICMSVSPLHPLLGESQYNLQHHEYLGAMSQENQQNYHITRLTFNPYFDQTTEIIDSFLSI